MLYFLILSTFKSLNSRPLQTTWWRRTWIDSWEAYRRCSWNLRSCRGKTFHLRRCSTCRSFYTRYAVLFWSSYRAEVIFFLSALDLPMANALLVKRWNDLLQSAVAQFAQQASLATVFFSDHALEWHLGQATWLRIHPEQYLGSKQCPT